MRLASSQLASRLIVGLAIAVGALIAPVLASAGTMSSSPVPYATEAVIASAGGGTLSVPATSSIQLQTGNTTTASGAGGSVVVVFTLPTGVAATGTVFGTVGDGGGGNCPGGARLTGSLGGTPSGNQIIFTLPTLANGAAQSNCTVTLNTFTITGATALQAVTPAGFVVSGQVISQSNATIPVDTSPATTALASSVDGLTLTPFAAPGFVDTGVNASLNGVRAPGKVFGTNGNDSLVFAAGTLEVDAAGDDPGAVAADGVSPFTFGTGADAQTSATVTLAGQLSGIGSIYFDPAGGACAPTAAAEAGSSGVKTATLSGSVATFTGVTFSSTPGTVCEYANGTSLIGVNPSGMIVAGTVPATSTTAAANVTSPATLGITAYSDGSPRFVTYGGNISSYPTFTRIVNNSSLPLQVYAYVQTDSGSLGSAVVESGLAPFTNDLVPDSTILSNAGVSPSPTGRASFIFFMAPNNNAVENAGQTTFGAGAGNISHLMVNPGGVVVQLGGNETP